MLDEITKMAIKISRMSYELLKMTELLYCADKILKMIKHCSKMVEEL
jgi:hypothetical protein